MAQNNLARNLTEEPQPSVSEPESSNQTGEHWKSTQVVIV